MNRILMYEVVGLSFEYVRRNNYFSLKHLASISAHVPRLNNS